MSTKRVSAAICLLACACVPSPTLPVSQGSLQASAQVNQACETLAAVNITRLRDVVPDWRPFDLFHAEARKGTRLLPSRTSDILLKLAIPGGSIAAPYGTSVFAAQQPDGRWLVSHVRLLQLPPPPQPPGGIALPPTSERVVTTGVLRLEAAERIKAAIGSKCLRREPAVSPASLPLLSGETAHCPPDGGQPHALEIIQNGNNRRYLRECGRTWATGIIMITLEDPRNIIPEG